MKIRPRGGFNMYATKPIRPTRTSFRSQAEYQKVENYASQKAKTHEPKMKRMRDLMQNHIQADGEEKVQS